MEKEKFNVEIVIKNTSLAHKSINDKKEIVFEHIFEILEQLCLIFK